MNTLEIILLIPAIIGAYLLAIALFTEYEKNTLRVVIGDILILPFCTAGLINKVSFLTVFAFATIFIGAILYAIRLAKK